MLAFAAAITTEAQTITLDMNGGAETCYSVGDIDYIDEMTLTRALEGRTDY